MIAEVVDDLIEDRVLVFGSLPPAGRDLDLLARPFEVRLVAEGLKDAGFVQKEEAWARFAEGTAQGIDLVPADDWGLPEEEVAALFDDALPIEPFRNLVRPAPHHVLLIVARRVLHGGGALDDKRRAYVTRALEEDPVAWERADEHGEAWDSARALELLRAGYSRGHPISRRDRVEAIAEEMKERGAPNVRARALALRSIVAGRGHRGAVVAISGLDGAGKSSQATALVESLQALGVEAATEWTRITRNRSLDLFAGPVKWVLRIFRPSGTPPPSASDDETFDPGREFRKRSPLVTQLWSVIVAVTNALTQRKATRPHLRAGRVVVCDRYVLDSAVHLRWLYGEDRRFSFQTALVRWLSPKPITAFFLDIDPEVAYERKPDFDLEELSAQAALYRRLHHAFSARPIDGRRERSDIAAEIAREVWLALP